MLDVAAIRVWKTSRTDFGVLALTFIVTLFGKIEWGFFAGLVGAMAVFSIVPAICEFSSW